MTQQTHGMPDLNYSEENFRELYKICKELADWDAGKFGKNSKVKIIEISKRATQIIAKVEVK